MKTKRNTILSIALMLLITSCATKVKFPVSSITPAAEITAHKKQDKNNNYKISITANYLASAERLSSSNETYVVWITTKENGIQNIGQLNTKNSKKSTLETLSPYDPIEIFITTEKEGNVSKPTGVEISRAKF